MSATQPLPKLSKASTSTPRGAQQRPQRHLEGAGIGAGHDADAVVGRHAQDRRLRSITSASLALPSAERCERPSRQPPAAQRPARPLGGGAGGKLRIPRSRVGLHSRRFPFGRRGFDKKRRILGVMLHRVNAAQHAAYSVPPERLVHLELDVRARQADILEHAVVEAMQSAALARPQEPASRAGRAEASR